MKPVRILLISLGSLVALLILAVVLALNSGVQTWAARKAIAGQPGLRASLGAVSIGLGRVEVQAVRAEQSGAVLTLPTLVAELPLLSAGLSQKVTVTKLVARGWILDLSKFTPPPAGAPAKTTVLNSAPVSFTLLSSAYAADPAAAAPVVAELFRGVFAQLRLPVDLYLDGLDLQGQVILPPGSGLGQSGRANVSLAGGGLGVGREGRLALDLEVTFAGENLPVSKVKVQGAIVVAMDTPRTFTRLAFEPNAVATGAQFPGGVQLSARALATRSANGESYVLALANAAQQLVGLNAEFAPAAGKLSGTWKLDVRSADLAPFALGRPLPDFAANGEGTFATDAAFADIRASGRLNASAEKLSVIKPELATVGAVRLVAEFDLAQRGNSTRIERLSADINGARPVVTVQALQAFELNAKTGELKVADPTKELVAITLHGVPLAWAAPFLKDIALTGGDLRGTFAATANNGGIALRPRGPLTIGDLAVTQAGKPLVRAVDFSLLMAADYAPAGWQADITALTLQSAGVQLFKLEAKAGQLNGADQPLKSTGQWSANIPALLAQPAAAGLAGLTRGNAAGEFFATVAAKTEVLAKLAFTDLVADPKLTAETLPTIAAEIRADIAADGKITLSAPLLFTRDGRKSDLSLSGTLATTTAGLAVDARLASALLVVEDVQILAAPFAGKPSAPATAAMAPSSTRDAKPAWAGISGQVALALKKVVYAQKFEVADVGGTIRIDAGALKLDGVRAGFSEGSEFKLNGGVTFSEAAPEPYILAANLDVTNFDPAPVFRALNPAQPPTVEGKFTVASKIAGQARNLGELGGKAHGDFALSSKGGVFRALSADVSSKVETTAKTASAVAFLGNVASAVTGRKEYGDAASKAEAVSALSKMISAIQYDQLNVVVTRDAALNTELKDFTLIAPELRLAGTGKITAKAKTDLLAQSLAMQFQLGARGHTGDLLKALGALDTTKKDDLGYMASTLPLKVTGTLGKPDTSELQSAMVKLAYEKSGAGDLLNKFLGGK